MSLFRADPDLFNDVESTTVHSHANLFVSLTSGIESATKRVTAVLIKNWFLIKLQNITMNRINFSTLGTESKLTTRTKREQNKTQDQTFSLEVHLCSPVTKI